MKSVVAFFTLAFVAGSPALAQGYSYSYGNSRVINQSQTGLYSPSSTYIGSGTLSRSAQGMQAGMSTIPASNGLPPVHMGGTIGTPGDNQYSQAAQEERRFGRRRMPQARMGAYIGTPGDNLRSDLHYYVPGQNGATSGVRQGHFTAPGYSYPPGQGTATYAEQGAYSVGRDGALHY